MTSDRDEKPAGVAVYGAITVVAGDNSRLTSGNSWPEAPQLVCQPPDSGPCRKRVCRRPTVRHKLVTRSCLVTRLGPEAPRAARWGRGGTKTIEVSPRKSCRRRGRTDDGLRGNSLATMTATRAIGALPQGWFAVRAARCGKRSCLRCVLSHAMKAAPSGDGVICCERVVTGARDSAATSQHTSRVAGSWPRRPPGQIPRSPRAAPSRVLSWAFTAAADPR